MIIYPDTWLEDIQSAYRAAGDAGDAERQNELIEAQTGTRPSRTPELLIIHIRHYPNGYGPQ